MKISVNLLEEANKSGNIKEIAEQNELNYNEFVKVLRYYNSIFKPIIEKSTSKKELTHEELEAYKEELQNKFDEYRADTYLKAKLYADKCFFKTERATRQIEVFSKQIRELKEEIFNLEMDINREIKRKNEALQETNMYKFKCKFLHVYWFLGGGIFVISILILRNFLY